MRKDLNAVVGEVAEKYYERDVEARMITIGILAAQHTLLLGPPGTGKSAIVRELTSRIETAVNWEILLSKFTAPSAIFGPIDVGALAQGTYRQVYDGHATQANIAFLDEIFKCSSAALNSMLAYLNERVYHPESGGAPVPCPLISAVCASNELGEDEATAALYDRLLIRMEVDYLAEPDSFDALLRSAVVAAGDEAPARTTVTLADLQHAITTEVPAVELPTAVIASMRDLRSELRGKEIISSDRRWKAAVRVLQASAWLDGRREVVVDDLAVLGHVLWDVPANRHTVTRMIRGYLSEGQRQVGDLVDEVDKIAADLAKRLENAAHHADPDSPVAEALQAWGMRTNVKLAKIGRTLRRGIATAEAENRNTGEHERALTRTQKVFEQLMTGALGIGADQVPMVGAGR
ncbi:ATPase [Streptomyces sp. WAC 05977]|nr:ATPase [Streptomyces sp. WAC 05977]